MNQSVTAFQKSLEWIWQFPAHITILLMLVCILLGGYYVSQSKTATAKIYFIVAVIIASLGTVVDVILSTAGI